MDRQEPEPLGLVLRVIGLGAVSSVVAALVELALGGVSLFHAPGLLGAAASSFIQIAPVEELCKLGVVLLFVWQNVQFNEENDGIVYVGSSAIGFALFENILYVVQKGIGTGVLRAFSSIPLHVFTGIILGMYVGRAKFTSDSRARTLLIIKGFALAWLFHGLYDTFAQSGNALALLLLPLLAGVSSFGIVTLRKGRRASLLRWTGTADTDRPGPVAKAASTGELTSSTNPSHFADASQTRDVSPVADVVSTSMVPQNPAPIRSKAPVWMAVISRLLLAACAGFWLLLVIGFAFPDSPQGAGDAILGGILLTFIPGCLGVLLEVGYRKRKKALGRA
jgi:RsiW-degrading membrane proteinase PrsW (M82 family)